MKANAKPLIRFSLGEEKVEPKLRDEFCIQKTSSGGSRLCFTTAADFIDLLLALSKTMEEPFDILYVLLLSRNGSQEAGRYQSPKLSRREMSAFLLKHKDFLQQDGRHNLWLHSSGDNSSIVYDRHEIAFAYGHLPEFESILSQSQCKKVNDVQRYSTSTHAHHYHEEFDTEETVLIEAFAWHVSPLRSQDLD